MTQDNSLRWTTWAIRAGAILAMCVGMGWLIAWLGGWAAAWAASGAITVKTNTALCLLLAGAALLLAAPGTAGRSARVAGAGLGAVVALVGALTLCEHLFSINLGIDQLLAAEPSGAGATASPNRMGPPGASSLALVGLGLLALALGRRRVVPYAGLAVCLIGLLPAVGYLFGAATLYTQPRVTGIAWPTVLVLISLGLGLLLAVRETGPMVLLLRDDAGGALLRRMLPVAVLLPLASRWLQALGEARGFYGPLTGDGIGALMVVLLFSVILWHNAARLSRSAAANAIADEALRASESQLQHAQQIADLGSWEWAIPSGALFWSEQVYRQLGEEPGRFQPSFDSFLQRVHPEDREKFQSAVQRAVAGEAPYELELRVVQPGGDTRVLQARGEVSRGPQGQPLRMTGVCLDITRRRQAEEEVRRLAESVQQERDKLTSLLNSISDEVWFADSAGQFTLVNRSGLREFGLEPQAKIDVGGRAQGLEVFRFDGTARPAQEAPPLRALQGEVIRNEEETIRTPASGELRHRQVSAAPVRDARGEIIGSVSVVRDITELKTAEVALRESEERLRLAQSGASLGIWERDLSTGKLSWTPEMERIFGYAPGTFPGTYEAFRERLHPDDVDHLERCRTEAVALGQPFDCDFRVQTPAAETRWVNCKGRAVYDPSGKAQRLLGVNVDITARKQAEEALRAERDFSAAVLEVAGALIVVLDPQGRITRFNRACETLTGYSAAEVSVRVFWEFLVPPAELPGVRSAWEGILAGTFPNEHENHWVAKDGSQRLIAWSNTAIAGPGGRIESVICTGMDVTRLRQTTRELFEATERWQALMRAVPVGVSFSDDATCQRITGNPAVLAQFEVRGAENLSASAPEATAPGRQVRFFRNGRPIADAELPLQRAVAENAVIPPMELEVHLPSGRQWFAEASGAPVRGAQGEVLGGLAVTVDITERKRAEAEVRRHAAELRASNSELIRFNEAMTGRELRMVELKREVDALRAQLGQPARYKA